MKNKVGKSLSEEIESLRIHPEMEAQLGTEKLLLTVPIRKPTRQEFIRVHSDPAFTARFPIIEHNEDKELFIITNEICKALPGDFFLAQLFLAISRQDSVFLWYVKVPKPGAKLLGWHTSALAAAEEAKKSWVKVVANQNIGAYEATIATANIPEPKWPEKSFNEILELGFKDKIINSPDHPIIKRLLGEA